MSRWIEKYAKLEEEHNQLKKLVRKYFRLERKLPVRLISEDYMKAWFPFSKVRDKLGKAVNYKK